MATSQKHSWGMTFGDVVDEAAERCGLDPASLSERHLNAARRSLNLLFTQLEREVQDMPFRLERVSLTIQNGMRAAVLPDGTDNVLDVVASISGTDYPLILMSGADYFNLANKSSATADRPSQYFVAQQAPTDLAWFDGASGTFDANGVMSTQRFGGGTATPTPDPTVRKPAIVVWPRPTSDVTLNIRRIRWFEDARFLGEDVDSSRDWYDVICSGLAARLAVKFAVERAAGLQSQYDATLAKTKSTITDRGPIVIGGRGFGRSRTWRV